MPPQTALLKLVEKEVYKTQQEQRKLINMSEIRTSSKAHRRQWEPCHWLHWSSGPKLLYSWPSGCVWTLDGDSHGV